LHEAEEQQSLFKQERQSARRQDMYSVIAVDVEKCTGCRMCEIACSLRNYNECNPARARIHVVRTRNGAISTTVPVLCRQCAAPLCVSLCPAQALRRDAHTNAIVVDKDKCVGCRTCVYVCPFGGPAVDPALGISQKCTLCDGDGEPMCVQVCAKGALTYVSAEEDGLRRKRSVTEKYLEHLDSVVE
jgi:anaerobic carbon-monoxide dehydrogenase iron sulfur subunit